MIERPMETAEASFGSPKRTTLKQRFCGFAYQHFAYSFFGLLFVLVFLLVGSLPETESSYIIMDGLMWMAGILSMTLYFPLGMLEAAWKKWAVPTGKEVLLGMGQPCLVSVTWAGLVLAGIFAEAWVVVMGLAVISALLAGPSSYFVLFFATRLPGTDFENLVFAALLAAVLPPMLFTLGSWWQAKRQCV